MPSFQNNSSQETALEEIRVELADVKHSLHSTSIELNLLEERMGSAENSKRGYAEEDVELLKRKFASLEKAYEKLSRELSEERSHRTQMENKLEEVANLRQLITSLAKEHSPKSSSTKTYQVKSGDTLEKIARAHHVSKDKLKQANNLSSDRILVGQKIVIPE